MTDIEDQLRRLHDEYGEFPVTEETVEVPRSAYMDCLRAAERDELGGARILLEDEGQVLLIRYEDDPEAWDIPGGSRERRESHAAAARRHVAEQVGLECELNDVFRALVYRFTLIEGEEGVAGLWLLFEGTPHQGDLDLGEGILEARWFENVPEAVDPHVKSRAETAAESDD